MLLVHHQLKVGVPASKLMAAIWGARTAAWPEDEQERMSLGWIMRSENIEKYAGAWEMKPYLGTLEWAKVERLTIRCKNAREKGAQGLDDVWPRLSEIRAGLMQGRQLLPNVLRDIAEQIMHAKDVAQSEPCPPVIMRWLEQKLANIGNGPSPSSGMTQDEMEQMLIRMRDLEEENARAEANA